MKTSRSWYNIHYQMHLPEDQGTMGEIRGQGGGGGNQRTVLEIRGQGGKSGNIVGNQGKGGNQGTLWEIRGQGGKSGTGWEIFETENILSSCINTHPYFNDMYLKCYQILLADFYSQV